MPLCRRWCCVLSIFVGTPLGTVFMTNGARFLIKMLPEEERPKRPRKTRGSSATLAEADVPADPEESWLAAEAGAVAAAEPALPVSSGLAEPLLDDVGRADE